MGAVSPEAAPHPALPQPVVRMRLQRVGWGAPRNGRPSANLDLPHSLPKGCDRRAIVLLVFSTMATCHLTFS